MHAETCVICNGEGKVNPDGKPRRADELVTCYGCNGKGWVEVSDGLNDIPIELWPTETTGSSVTELLGVCRDNQGNS